MNSAGSLVSTIIVSKSRSLWEAHRVAEPALLMRNKHPRNCHIRVICAVREPDGRVPGNEPVLQARRRGGQPSAATRAPACIFLAEAGGGQVSAVRGQAVGGWCLSVIGAERTRRRARQLCPRWGHELIFLGLDSSSGRCVVDCSPNRGSALSPARSGSTAETRDAFRFGADPNHGRL
jgi:hypothetical protein